MDEKGDLDWQKSYGGSGNDFLQSFDLTNDGGFILAGTSNSSKSIDKKDDCIGDKDIWIIKLNAKGAEEWQKTLGGYSQEKTHSIAQTKDGGYILGCTSSSGKSGSKTEESFGSEDCWILKLDYKGNIEWQKTYGGDYVDELRSIEQTTDGGYIVGAYSNSSYSGSKEQEAIGEGDYWIFKLDKDGTMSWQKTIGGNGDDHLYVTHQTYDGGYIIGGNSNSVNGGDKNSGNVSGTDVWLLKLQQDGGILWQKTYDFGEVDNITSLLENEDHTFLIGCYSKGKNDRLSRKSKSQEDGTEDFIAIKLNENGEEIWKKTAGSNGIDILKKVVETRDGGYLLAGTSNPYPVKLSSNNNNIGVINNLSQYTEENKDLQNAKNEINNEISNVADDVNKEISNTTSSLMQKGNDALGIKENSGFKLRGVDHNNRTSLPLLGEGNASSNNSAISNPLPKMPASRDKKDNFGSSDFWVVKLRDSNKPKVIKQPIEAFPNPTSQFTNVILNHDFKNGKASVFDLAGRQLQNFEINQKTIPLDLSGFPEGIYIVNIKTDKEEGSVKIIKGNKIN
jgi:hypothetical protein